MYGVCEEQLSIFNLCPTQANSHFVRLQFIDLLKMYKTCHLLPQNKRQTKRNKVIYRTRIYAEWQFIAVVARRYLAMPKLRQSCLVSLSQHNRCHGVASRIFCLTTRERGRTITTICQKANTFTLHVHKTCKLGSNTTRKNDAG